MDSRDKTADKCDKAVALARAGVTSELRQLVMIPPVSEPLVGQFSALSE